MGYSNENLHASNRHRQRSLLQWIPLEAETGYNQGTLSSDKEGPMIQQVVAAPKQSGVDEGLVFAQTHQLGYEIPVFVSPDILDQPNEAILEWKQKISPIRGMVTLHGPVYDLNPVSLDPNIAAASKLRYQQAVNVAKALGCRYLVVHSQFNTIFSVARVKTEWMNATIDFWQQFAAECLQDSPGLSIVLENFMEEEPGQLRAMVDRINHLQIKACLDTGHANIFSKASVNAWLDELEHQLVYIHSHNNYGHEDEHRGYSYGTLDMEGFINHLIQLPYKVTLALEIFNQPELEESYRIVQRYMAIQQENIPEKTFLI